MNKLWKEAGERKQVDDSTRRENGRMEHGTRDRDSVVPAAFCMFSFRRSVP